MKCSDFLREISDYLDGFLDARTKSELEEHLSWCRNCYVICDTTRQTIEIYRHSELSEFPNGLRERLHDALMRKRRGDDGMRASLR